MNDIDDDVLDLLEEWLEAKELGNELTAEELCSERPDLILIVKARLNDLKAIEWLEANEDDLNPESPADFGLPEKIGRYRLVKLLGEGGFGQVWEGNDPVLHRKVAIKLPRRDRFSPNQLKSFIAEAKRIAALKHPGIVPIFDVGKSNDLVFIVSEFVEAKNLADLSESRKFHQSEVQDIIAKTADVLFHAHAKGFIHRDIKPSNILLASDGQVFLTDFGIAASPEELVGKKTSIGTLTYMSPEQESGEKLDHRSDIYSLGLVMLELLTGKIPPFGEHRLNEIQKRVNSLRVNGNLKNVVQKSLTNAPKDRFESAAEMNDALTSSPKRKWLKITILFSVCLLIGYLYWQPNLDTISDLATSPNLNKKSREPQAALNSDKVIVDPSDFPYFLSVTSGWIITSNGSEIGFKNRDSDYQINFDVPENVTAITSHDELFAFATKDGLIRIRTLESDPKETFVLNTGMQHVEKIVFNEYSNALVCCSEQGDMQVWNLKTNTPTKAVFPQLRNKLADIKYVENQLIILANNGDGQGEILIWEVDPNRKQISNQGFAELSNLEVIVASNSGKRILVSEGETIRVLELVRLPDLKFRMNQTDEFICESPIHPEFASDDLLIYCQSGLVNVRDVIEHETRMVQNLKGEFTLLQVQENTVVVIDEKGNILSRPISPPKIPTTTLPSIKPIEHSRSISLDLSHYPSNTTILRLNDSSVTDSDLRQLPRMNQLEMLELRKTNIGDEGCEFIGQLKSLQRLNLTMTNVTDAGIAKLRNLTGLRHLRLSYTGITDTGMKYLDSFPMLELLELRDTRVTQRAIADFMRSHPRCKVTPP